MQRHNIHWTKIDISLVFRGKEMCRRGHVAIKFPLPGLHLKYGILMHLSFDIEHFF